MTTFHQTPFNSLIFEHIEENRFLIFKESHLTICFYFKLLNCFFIILMFPTSSLQGCNIEDGPE